MELKYRTGCLPGLTRITFPFWATIEWPLVAKTLLTTDFLLTPGFTKTTISLTFGVYIPNKLDILSNSKMESRPSLLIVGDIDFPDTWNNWDKTNVAPAPIAILRRLIVTWCKQLRVLWFRPHTSVTHLSYLKMSDDMNYNNKRMYS